MTVISYLVHFEGSGDGLNQDCTTDGSAAHADVVLSKVEGVVPQPGFKM